MPRAKANGIELEFDTFGQESHDPLLLIMGLGGQMLLWNEEFCEMLAERGHFVIRFDNRDVGLSTWCDDKGVPDLMALSIIYVMADGVMSISIGSHCVGNEVL